MTTPPESPGAMPGLVVALVNNMPVAAMEATEDQFRGLLTAGPGVTVELFRLDELDDPTGRHRSASVLVEALRDSPAGSVSSGVDAVVVTGTEPRCARFADEVYWASLVALLDVLRTGAVPSYLSCLAAHAELEHAHGVPRRRLPAKLSALVCQPVIADPLTRGLGARVCFPHSRVNDVAPADLAAAGFRLLVGDGAGWTIAAGGRPGRPVLLAQGHPEYGPASLLREYRRDVRRYLTGERPDYPPLPRDHLPGPVRRSLEHFARQARAARDPAMMEAFPPVVASALGHPWHDAARTLVGNWLEEVRRRPAARRRALRA
jgi:homoserine O-succinyltransferase